MASKTQPPADEYGYLMHTALRKCCDSTPTSIAWNAVHLLGPTWATYCSRCSEAGAVTGEALLKVFEEHGLNTDDREKDPKGEWYARSILDMAFEQFDEGDWDGMASYLRSYPS